MESNMNANPEYPLQERINRVAEGALMLGASLTGLWLLWVLAYSFLK